MDEVSAADEEVAVGVAGVAQVEGGLDLGGGGGEAEDGDADGGAERREEHGGKAEEADDAGEFG